ncbi:RNA polymerase sigma factor SigC [Mastigocoleus testarum]|uniref:RNA polymerase sigma factor n=1 Tax=Mastigocoleus testarum BC008 TaxID=371196 RepID=A0A0V7ZXF2_9CYAN|nr:RNA polymerase sigma factor SigC [Mastigocoleus testarum]KST63079.1 RNA polymerase subunit sigma [Mastigocoleus testarum BC008]KST69063.1 RNA polymerase subunit sigma [Mastigocoleus testarum BC008]
MPATSFYADATYDSQQSNPQVFDPEIAVDESELPTDSIEDLEIAAQESVESVESVSHNTNTSRRSTDLVRLYLQEIGRVRLLGRDEEVSEAQKVQRYLRLRILLSESAKQDREDIISSYLQIVEIHERLTSELGHRPSFERWAKTAGMEVVELKQMLSRGKRRWAEIAGLTVGELEKLQSQGLQAKEHMIKANLRLVVSVAKKYQNRGLELLDLVQEGTLGLERAVEKFDPTKGYRFSTYAYWWIRQGITRAIATSSRTIRLPVHITEKLNKIKKAQRKIAQEKGRTPTLEDLAIELEMTPTQVREVLLRVPRSVSLETKVGKDKDTELGELLETDGITPEDMLMRESLQRDLQNLLADLTTRERDVILMRFGLADGHPYSLAEIGRALDLSRERVRQIESKALQKLRQPKRRNLIRDYLESLS